MHDEYFYRLRVGRDVRLVNTTLGNSPNHTFIYGFGRVNIAQVLRFPGDPFALQYHDVTPGLSTGQVHSYPLELSTSMTREQLKVTLVWTDYPATEGAAHPLVNDLDLVVMSPSGLKFVGNRHLGQTPNQANPTFETEPDGSVFERVERDNVNNVEQVVVPVPESGTYSIQVHGALTPYGPQSYALVFTYGSGAMWSGCKSVDGQTVRTRTVTCVDESYGCTIASSSCTDLPPASQESCSIPPADSPSGLSVGAIAGIAISAVAAGIVAVAVSVFLVRRRQRSQSGEVLEERLLDDDVHYAPL